MLSIMSMQNKITLMEGEMSIERALVIAILVLVLLLLLFKVF